MVFHYRRVGPGSSVLTDLHLALTAGNVEQSRVSPSNASSNVRSGGDDKNSLLQLPADIGYPVYWKICRKPETWSGAYYSTTPMSNN